MVDDASVPVMSLFSQQVLSSPNLTGDTQALVNAVVGNDAGDANGDSEKDVVHLSSLKCGGGWLAPTKARVEEANVYRCCPTRMRDKGSSIWNVNEMGGD